MDILNSIKKMWKSGDYKTFLLFLLLSILIWHIEKLQQTYTVTTPIKIKCKNVPTGYIIPPDLASDIQVNVEGSGYNILEMYILNHHNVTINVSSLKRLSSGGQTWALYIPRRLQLKQTDLPEHMKILDVLTDTVMIPLLKVRQAKLPVKICQQTSLEPQHLYTAPTRLTPDSVIVTATNDIIDTMRAVYTKVQQPVVLSDTVTFSLPLDIPERAVANYSTVDVKYFVEPFTEKKISVPIVGINCPKGFTYKIFPASATVSFYVGLSKYESADAKAFSIEADFSKIRPGEKGSRLRLYLKDTPQGVTKVTVSPMFVSFLLEKER